MSNYPLWQPDSPAIPAGGHDGSPLLHHSMGTRLIDLAHSLRRVTFAANLLPPGID